tara:strand:+ start:4828 stop:5073 length:246 start_codon:yes stop_codon:yes gene_type:complete
MEDEEVFQAVREINKLMSEARIQTDIANKALKQADGLLKQLLDATRKKTTQSSLDDFATKSSSDIKERLTLEDITKMILED